MCRRFYRIEVAEEIGVEEAIIYEWLYIADEGEWTEINGEQWIRMSSQDFVNVFPEFQNRKRIERILNSLIESKLIKKENLNKNKYDKTFSYCVIVGMEE
jgi:adenine-specific DNA methylase